MEQLQHNIACICMSLIWNKFPGAHIHVCSKGFYTIASQLHEWHRVVQYQKQFILYQVFNNAGSHINQPLVLPLSIISTVQWPLSLIEVGLVGEQGSLAGHH